MTGHTNIALRTSALPTTQAAIRGAEGTNRALQQLEQRRRTGVAEGIQREGFEEQKRATGVREGQAQQTIDVAAQKEIADRFGRLIDSVINAPEASRPEAYTRARAAAARLNPEAVASLPEKFTPELLTQLRTLRAEFSNFKQIDQTKTFAPTTIQDPDNPDRFIKVIPQFDRSGKMTLKILGETKDLTPGEIASLEGEKAFEKEKGKASAQKITKGVDRIEKITQNILNIDKAIQAVKDGAGTGAIERLFPSIKAASVELDQLQGELALDVVGNVTFGALSKGELDLAKSVAIPTGLDGPELIDWLQRKKAAQSRVRDYFSQQVQFLDAGGSIAGFLKEQNEGQQGGATAQEGDIVDGPDGKSFRVVNGQLVPLEGNQ